MYRGTIAKNQRQKQQGFGREVILFTVFAKLFDLCGQLKLLSGRECIIVKFDIFVRTIASTTYGMYEKLIPASLRLQ